MKCFYKMAKTHEICKETLFYFWLFFEIEKPLFCFKKSMTTLKIRI